MIPENPQARADLQEDTHQPVAEGLDDVATFKTLKEWYRVDQSHSAAWRRQAKSDFEFVTGEQWTAEDKRVMEDQGRVPITFNRTLPILKAISGLEINSRQETVFMPRNTTEGEVRANEILTAASQWMADGCDAMDAQSEAFFDACVCGMGWTEITIEYDEDPDGKYIERHIDPLDMFWDYTCREKNLIDATRVFRVKEMRLSEAREMFPDEFDDDLDAYWAIGGDNEAADPIAVEERRLKLRETDGYDPNQPVRIVHAQWIENEPFVRTINPHTGAPHEMGLDEFEAMSEALQQSGMPAPPAAEQVRKVYRQAFLGNKILGKVNEGLSKEGFTFQCITGQPKRTKGVWDGIVAVIRDPQMWANKWLTQTLHILNTTAKGGILAEQDAFVNMRDAQETYARPDAITEVKRGAISGNKIMPKPGVGMANGYVQLLQYSIDSIPQVSGINMEMLGLRDVNQPGVLEAHRKQAGMTILAPLMDSKTRYCRNIGRIRLDLIQRYFSDGRLIRVAGKDGVQELRPLIQNETIGDYEVIVEDAPTSPNSKEQTWATIQQVLPAFKELLTPEAVIAILEYSPLPQKLISAFRDMADQGPSPQEQAIEQFQMQSAIAEEGRKAAESAAKVNKDDADADQKRLKGVIDAIQAGIAVNQAQIDTVQAAVALNPPASPSQVQGEDGYVLQPEQPPMLPHQLPTIQPRPPEPELEPEGEY